MSEVVYHLHYSYHPVDLSKFNLFISPIVYESKCEWPHPFPSPVKLQILVFLDQNSCLKLLESKTYAFFWMETN